jgi:hypothetical protein
MKNRNRFVLSVLDRLEERVALSHGMMAPAQVAPVETTPPQKQVIDLQGTVKGFAIPSPLASPIPGDLLLIGKGKVAPLGQVSLVGPFSIRSGEPTFYDGRVALSNPRGGVEVHIFGIVPGPSGRPAHLHYEILSGWGAYLGATGKGSVVYDQGLVPVGGRTPFSMTFGSPTPTATA